MAVQKTKSALIEAARLLFTRNGYDETTMADVAREAKKGRRTLYTHFVNKESLLRAVIDTELNKIYDILRAICEKDIPADRKIMELIISRLNNVRHSIFRNGSLRADFSRYFWAIDSIRRRYDKMEISLIRRVLLEGREQGLFFYDDADVMALIIHYSVKGLEMPYIRGEIVGEVDRSVIEHNAKMIILRALGVADIR